MKTIIATAGLVLLSVAAHAQNLDRPQLRLKPLSEKLDLNYMGGTPPPVYLISSKSRAAGIACFQSYQPDNQTQQK